MILQDSPAVVGPPARLGAVQCVECHQVGDGGHCGYGACINSIYLQVLDDDDHCECEQCGAPVCGPQCAQGKWHRLECPLLAAANYKWVKIFLLIVFIQIFLFELVIFFSRFC